MKCPCSQPHTHGTNPNWILSTTVSVTTMPRLLLKHMESIFHYLINDISLSPYISFHFFIECHIQSVRTRFSDMRRPPHGNYPHENPPPPPQDPLGAPQAGSAPPDELVETANDERTRLTSGEPHSGHCTSTLSFVLRINSSNTSPHFAHLNSYMGMGITPFYLI